MIKNVVFDIGNVLLRYSPEDFTRHFVSDPQVAEQICRQVFSGPEWPMLDRGVLTHAQALESMLQRGSAHAQLVIQVYNGWQALLKPIDGTVKILKSLNKAGFGLYYLSNYAHESFEDAFERFDFFRLFAGGVVSYQVHVNKPEAGIYRALLQKFLLDPAQCLFIDDMPANVEGAKSAGMNALLFQSPGQLARSLAAYGVIPDEMLVQADSGEQ